MNTDIAELVKSIFESEKFEKIIKNGEIMYFDKDMKVYIPKENISALVHEITADTHSGKKLDNTNEHYDLCQVRVMRLLKKGLPDFKNISYKTVFMKYLSQQFLMSNTNSELWFSSLYVDLVGSTLMSMKLNNEQMTTLVNVFTQEMTSIVSANNGHVLKYAGDAVIAFFPKSDSNKNTDALKCAQDMLNMLERGINSALIKKDFDSLSIRIGIESGTNKIMIVGHTVDIIGKTMNIAAKVTSIAKPNGIAIGQNYHDQLPPKIQKMFSKIELDSDWKYKSEDGSAYKVFENMPSV
jgi:hypothetical protein